MRAALAGLLLATLVGGCTRDASDVTSLTVFAAASLAEAFGAIEADFEAAHPDVDVRLVFAGSQVLRLQIEQGADADVFASANPAHAAALADAGLVADPVAFARNELVVIVPDTSDAIDSFDDLADAERIVLGTPEVPIGAWTDEMFGRARVARGDAFVDAVLSNVVSRESNVRLVRARVELGEADAAVVYRTDALAGDAVRAVPIPADLNVSASYLIAPVTSPDTSQAAASFVAWVLSADGQRRLNEHGFDGVDP